MEFIEGRYEVRTLVAALKKLNKEIEATARLLCRESGNGYPSPGELSDYINKANDKGKASELSLGEMFSATQAELRRFNNDLMDKFIALGRKHKSTTDLAPEETGSSDVSPK